MARCLVLIEEWRISTTSCRTTTSRAWGRRRTRSCNGRSKRTEGFLSRYSSSLIRIFQRSSGSSTVMRPWTNSRILVEQGKEEYRQVPIEVTDRTLSEEDRLRVWIYIHRQRKEWDAKEKEMVAYRLVDMMGRASAANVFGVSRFANSTSWSKYSSYRRRFTSLRDPSAAITWSRELMGVSKKLLTPSVIEAVVKKVNQKRVTNSKDLRKLRTILPDPVARAAFPECRRYRFSYVTARASEARETENQKGRQERLLGKPRSCGRSDEKRSLDCIARTEG